MATTFDITHDRNFLQHFLTKARVLSISDETVALMRDSDDPYAAYGYGQWLRYTNRDKDALKTAEQKLTYAASHNVQDAYVALAEMYYDGSVEEDNARHDLHHQFVQKAYAAGSERAQYHTLLSTVYGHYGYPEDPEMVADILQKHLEKNPGSDPIYWDLLGRAMTNTDPDQAIRNFKTAIERGNSDSYHRLALLYENNDAERYEELTQEGKAHDCIPCYCAKACTEQETFLELSDDEQQALHDEIVNDLNYAIDHYYGYACYLLAANIYNGDLGFEQDIAEAIRVLQRGCQLNDDSCFGLLALIHETMDIPEDLRLTPQQIAKLRLEAVRRDNQLVANLEAVARAYVQNLLPEHNAEIELLWLEKYREVSTAEEDENGAQATGLIISYPQGFYYCKDVDAEPFDSLHDLAANIGADGVDVVHYSDLLTRISKALCLDKDGCHVAMLADRNGFAKDLPDNMGATIIYGHGYEIRGAVMFVLEDEKYNLKPFRGIQLIYMFLQMLNAATDGLLRMPTDEELESINPDHVGGYEEYDDTEYLDDDTEDTGDEQDEKAEPADDDTPPQTLTVKMADVETALQQCNLCRDTLFVEIPDDPQYQFMQTEDLIRPYKEDIEANIERHGGYMIDEWQFVDQRQTPINIMSRVRFK